jgi:hypothetical protein
MFIPMFQCDSMSKMTSEWRAHAHTIVTSELYLRPVYIVCCRASRRGLTRLRRRPFEYSIAMHLILLSTVRTTGNGSRDKLAFIKCLAIVWGMQQNTGNAGEIASRVKSRSSYEYDCSVKWISKYVLSRICIVSYGMQLDDGMPR